MEQDYTAKIKALLGNLAAKIPRTLISFEKLEYINNEIVDRLEVDDMILLRSFFNSLLHYMRKVEASDIDIGGYGTRGMVWFRVHGKKKPVPGLGGFDTDELDILIQTLLMKSQREHLIEHKNLDFSYVFKNSEGETFRNRADVYIDLDSIALNMRAINTQIRPYSNYDFHEEVTRIFSLEHTKEGLILITGITGSGKSTTLDPIVDMNNQTVEGHIVIIASPIEFVHTSKKCIVRHREVGRDTESFKQGTVEALRQDPDIIVIGEMRDPDTIMRALEAADSGHKVISTLHTSSAVESIDRIIGEVRANDQDRVRNRLADVLKCVISQKLIPGIGGKRVMAKEIMVMTPPIRSTIKNENTSEIYQLINEGQKYGMFTVEQDLKLLYEKRSITLENAFNYANNKRRIQQLIHSK